MLHRSLQSFSETSIHLKLCLCGCRSWRLHNSAPLEPTGDSRLRFHDIGHAEARSKPCTPHVSPSSFPEMCWTKRDCSCAAKILVFCNQIKFASLLVLEIAFFGPCRVLLWVQVFWFYCSCAVRTVCRNQDTVVFAGWCLSLENTKWVGQACYFSIISNKISASLSSQIKFQLLSAVILSPLQEDSGDA